VGQSPTAAKHLEIETKFFSELPKNAGLKGSIVFNSMDVAGVKPADALRLIRTGAFDIMSTQIGQAARDEPFFEGLDLVGVATDVPALRKSVDAFRATFDKRLQEKFNAKAMTLWPFGPQVIFCSVPIKGIADLKGHKVRVFTASMSELVNYLGGTAITMPGSEVYTALQRGVVECAITSPTSGNTSKWPELTTHFFPLGLAGSVQGHFMNLDAWKRLAPEQQVRMQAEFARLEAQMWDLAISSNQDGSDCNIGRDSCKEHQKFKMALVPVTPEDVRAVKTAAERVVLPLYKTACTRTEPRCMEIWNATVGKAQAMAIH
jgi:TRAP-type C4-dicarboxylate transport system substrate-binding protein